MIPIHRPNIALGNGAAGAPLLPRIERPTRAKALAGGPATGTRYAAQACAALQRLEAFRGRHFPMHGRGVLAQGLCERHIMPPWGRAGAWLSTQLARLSGWLHAEGHGPGHGPELPDGDKTEGTREKHGAHASERLAHRSALVDLCQLIDCLHMAAIAVEPIGAGSPHGRTARLEAALDEMGPALDAAVERACAMGANALG